MGTALRYAPQGGSSSARELDWRDPVRKTCMADAIESGTNQWCCSSQRRAQCHRASFARVQDEISLAVQPSERILNVIFNPIQGHLRIYKHFAKPNNCGAI